MFDPIKQTVSLDVPDGVTAWEVHTRQLAARAVRLQDEHAARLEEQNEERRRPQYTGQVERIVSPFQALVGKVRAKRDGDGQGFLSRLFNW